MGIPSIQTALNAGELAPSLFGRTDLDKFRKGASTMRNFFASYRGGATSRAGTKFVGQCYQSASIASDPPVLIPFQFSPQEGIAIEAGDQYFRFVTDGAYITEAPLSVSAVTNANPGVISVSQSFSTSDWVYVSGWEGLTALNGRIFKVNTATSTSITLASTLTGISTSTVGLGSYSGGGTVARIYTLTTPYAVADVPWIKWTQSADTMTLNCINQDTDVEYPPYDLQRISSANWTLTQTDFGTSIAAPTTSSASSTAAGSFYYQYLATAVDQETGEESIASPITTITSANISQQAGTITINVAGVTGAGSYNFYRAPETYNTTSVSGNIFGFVGSSFGPAFTDSNITPDYTISPPLATDPFATATVQAVMMTAFGTGYNQLNSTVTISSTTGVGFTGYPVVIAGQIRWVVTTNGGANYSTSDTVIFGGGGSGASASLDIGPRTGTYPSVAAYFQQRRFYANSLNAPDTYWGSQPGAYENMDVSVPVQDDDAIVGSPWSQQVNGIQWLINMPGGLVVLTGLGAWQLSGGGSGAATSNAITPSNQVANPQAYNGISPLIRPITINYDILYVQEKGSIVRDLSYNFFVNIYTGTDLTVLSNHLFDGYQILRWDWAEEPYKLLWAVRNDGVLLCLTFLKEQEVYAWTRHDTNGLFQSVCCISEPPVNAPYFIVKRLIQNDGVTPIYVYYMERMDNRLWNYIDDAWCVDAGLAYPLSSPAATLVFATAEGTQTLQQPDLLWGGSGYSTSSYGNLSDPTGTGATVALTISSGVITNIVFGGTLTDYTDPSLQIIDPTGMGSGATASVFSYAVNTITASPGVFSNVAGDGAEGDVIHYGSAQMTVTAYNSSTSLTVNMLRPIVSIYPNDPEETPIPALAGEWTIAAPTSTPSGLNHLEGMQVSILADGVVVAPQTVENGTVTLPFDATQIKIGLGYICQLQTMYLEMPGAPVTVQGRRKQINNLTVRVEGTAGPFEIGSDQYDASLTPGLVGAEWLSTSMTAVVPPIVPQNPLQPFGLFTGDIYQNVQSAMGYDKGQIAVQQRNPLPLNVLALMPWWDVGDDPSQS